MSRRGRRGRAGTATLTFDQIKTAATALATTYNSSGIEWAKELARQLEAANQSPTNNSKLTFITMLAAIFNSLPSEVPSAERASLTAFQEFQAAYIAAVLRGDSSLGSTTALRRQNKNLATSTKGLLITAVAAGADITKIRIVSIRKGEDSHTRVTIQNNETGEERVFGMSDAAALVEFARLIAPAAAPASAEDADASLGAAAGGGDGSADDDASSSTAAMVAHLAANTIMVARAIEAAERARRRGFSEDAAEDSAGSSSAPPAARAPEPPAAKDDDASSRADADGSAGTDADDAAAGTPELPAALQAVLDFATGYLTRPGHSAGNLAKAGRLIAACKSYDPANPQETADALKAEFADFSTAYQRAGQAAGFFTGGAVRGLLDGNYSGGALGFGSELYRDCKPLVEAFEASIAPPAAAAASMGSGATT